jgi:hypothetical protein
MKEQDPARPGYSGGQQPIETLQDIRRMMERSSRFITLSGLSGVSAGICALTGSWFARNWIIEYQSPNSLLESDYRQLLTRLLLLALAVLVAALVTAFYFTWRKARHNQLPIWDLTARRFIINMLIPLVSGGLLILAMLQYYEWRFVAPASLIFYGLALVNGSRYTLSDVKYLGFFQIVLGLVNTQFPGYGLYFWAAGFGVLHIVYGLIMWWKYDNKTEIAVN